MTPTATHNLNLKLGAPSQRAAQRGAVARSWKQSPIRSSAPPVRIVGFASRYQGGYRVNG